MNICVIICLTVKGKVKKSGDNFAEFHVNIECIRSDIVFKYN